MAEQVRLSRSFSCRVKDDSEGNEVTGGVKDEVLNVAWESRTSPVLEKRHSDWDVFFLCRKGSPMNAWKNMV